MYCIVILKHFKEDVRYLGLSEMTWELPDWVWRYSAWQHADAFGDPYRRGATHLGIHMATSNVYEDLDTLRRYGNAGAHARSYLYDDRLGQDDEVYLAAVRLALSFLVWHGRCGDAVDWYFPQRRSRM